MNTPTTDQQLHPAFTELEVCLGMLHDLGELQECEHDNAFVVAAESIQEEITGVLRRELSPDLQRWVERYAEVGSRNPFLWKWCCRGVEVTTLPCAQPDAPEELCDTKVLGVMFDVLLDDVADQQGDATLLEHLISLTSGHSQTPLSQFPSVQQAYVRVTTEVWNEIQSRVRRYPRFEEYAELLRYDYMQLLNTMRYSHLLNQSPALLNLAEHDLYLPHNMHMMVSATIDVMCSPAFDRRELGLLREAVWHAQCMGRIGNLITTWERELGEGDYTSGVFARAVSQGDLSVDDLLGGDQQRIEAAIRNGDHETHFLGKWHKHRRQILSMQPRIRSVDLKQLVAGLDHLICLHLGSRGNK